MFLKTKFVGIMANSKRGSLYFRSWLYYECRYMSQKNFQRKLWCLLVEKLNLFNRIVTHNGFSIRKYWCLSLKNFLTRSNPDYILID